jgi:hypothetical protein
MTAIKEYGAITYVRQSECSSHAAAGQDHGGRPESHSTGSRTSRYGVPAVTFPVGGSWIGVEKIAQHS